MDKSLINYIRSEARIYAFAYANKNHSLRIKFKELAYRQRKECAKGLKAYASFRMKLLKNPEVNKIEQEILTKTIKLAVKYVAKEYGVAYTEPIDKVVEHIVPLVVEDVNNLRYNLFKNTAILATRLETKYDEINKNKDKEV